ncbi:MAG TPA: MBL fold metallo-hydrolase [Burkholderiaceae bacterium]
MSGGCASTNPYYDAAKPHHRKDGYANNYAPNPAYRRPDIGFFQGWLNRLRAWTDDADARAPSRPIATVAPDLAFLRANRSVPSVTWVGHATMLVQTGTGLNILTDPVFEERASPVSFAGPARHQPPGVALADLPHIDAIVLSHAHYDHLSLPSLRALYAQVGGPPILYAPLGIDLWLAKNVTDGDTRHIVKLDWWDKASLHGTQFQLLPVQHWSQRSLWDRNATLWGAYAITSPGFRFFFSGDLGYSKDIADIAARTDGFDMAAIGVGAYQPVWYRNSHITPEEALRIHQQLRIGRSIAMHWGTFALGDERLDQPVADLEIARKKFSVREDAFIVIRHGETQRLVR